MSSDLWSLPRTAGAVLVASTIVFTLGFGVLALQGRLGGMAASFRGVEGIGDAAIAQRLIEPYLRPALVLMVIGFALLGAYLSDHGGQAAAAVAVPFLVIGAALMVVEGSFHATVTAWAGERWSATGDVPALYEPLRRWVNESVQTAYSMFMLGALVCFGWGLLATNTGPTWIAWISIGWSGGWFVLFGLGILGLPAAILVPPALIGAGLLLAPGVVPTG